MLIERRSSKKPDVSLLGNGHFPRTIPRILPPDNSPSQLGQFPPYRSKPNLKITYIHKCMHTCIHIYTYMHIHIDACTHVYTCVHGVQSGFCCGGSCTME